MLEVFWVPLPDEVAVDQVAEQAHILDPDELATYSRYRVDFKKVEFMTGRMLVKSLLAARLHTEPGNIRFTKNEYGRPALSPAHGPANLFFNLSHTDRIVACLVSPWAEAGIDVEQPMPDHLEVMPSVFLPAEIAFILAQPSLQGQLNAFGLLWTRKEAVMKAAGMGFHLAPKSFTVPFGWEGAADAAYVYRTYRLDATHLCSLALSRRSGVSDPATEVHRVDFATLFSGGFKPPMSQGRLHGKAGVIGAGSSFLS